MADAFDTLGLPCSLLLNREEIEQAWRNLSQVHHPDASSSGKEQEISADLNKARQTLSKPGGLLFEWLAIRSPSPREHHVPVSPELMDLFSLISRSLSEADEVIDSVRKAQTSLARSLFATKTIKAQKEVQQRLAEISRAIGEIRDQFPGFETASSENPPSFEKAGDALSELKFLEKWEGECQKRLLTFVELD